MREPRLRGLLAAVALAALALTGCAGTSASPDAPSAATQVGPASVPSDPDRVVPLESTAEPALPVTVRSFDGVDVTITDASRILAVDLYGTYAEIVFSLGLGDRVVGRDVATGFPQAAHLPVVSGTGHDLNLEAILALDPTVVLTDSSIGPAEVLDQLREAGVAVVQLDPARTLAGIDEHITAVAQALGVPEAGSELIARVDGELAEARQAVPAGTDAPRVAFLYVRGSAGVYLMGGPGSGADSLIEAVGGQDAGTAIGLDTPFTPITSEGMINAAPDVLLVMSHGLESVGGVDALVAMPGIGQTPAGENRRVIDVPDAELLSFGPSTSRTVLALAQALYG